MKKQRRVGKCPRCGSPPQEILEQFTGAISWALDRQGRIADPEGYNLGGDPNGTVEARCDCGFRWRLRGVYQMTGIERVISQS